MLADCVLYTRGRFGREQQKKSASVHWFSLCWQEQQQQQSCWLSALVGFFGLLDSCLPVSIQWTLSALYIPSFFFLFVSVSVKCSLRSVSFFVVDSHRGMDKKKCSHTYIHTHTRTRHPSKTNHCSLWMYALAMVIRKESQEKKSASANTFSRLNFDVLVVFVGFLHFFFLFRIQRDSSSTFLSTARGWLSLPHFYTIRSRALFFSLAFVAGMPSNMALEIREPREEKKKKTAHTQQHVI